MARRKAKQYFRSQQAAVDRIEAIQQAEGIDCDFKRLDAYLFAAQPDHQQQLEDELGGLPHHRICRRGWVDNAPVPGRQTGRALRFPSHARFHPRKYLAGLIATLQEQGVRFHADTAVTSMEEKDGGVTLSTRNGPTLRGRFAVIATNSPINNLVAIHSKQAPYRTYVLPGASRKARSRTR